MHRAPEVQQTTFIPDGEPSKAVFVKGLSKGTTALCMQNLFCRFGVVVDCQVSAHASTSPSTGLHLHSQCLCRDNTTRALYRYLRSLRLPPFPISQLARHRSGRPAGFAIISFATPGEAFRALQATDGSFFNGRQISVRWYNAARDGPVTQPGLLPTATALNNLTAPGQQFGVLPGGPVAALPLHQDPHQVALLQQLMENLQQQQTLQQSAGMMYMPPPPPPDAARGQFVNRAAPPATWQQHGSLGGGGSFLETQPPDWSTMMHSWLKDPSSQVREGSWSFMSFN